MNNDKRPIFPLLRRTPNRPLTSLEQIEPSGEFQYVMNGSPNFDSIWRRIFCVFSNKIGGSFNGCFSELATGFFASGIVPESTTGRVRTCPESKRFTATIPGTLTEAKNAECMV